jgi:rubrerythrin
MIDVEAALKIVRPAIQNEVAGQRFYNDAAYHCIDLWAKETFADLAKEEEVHTNVLLLLYDSLKTHGRWIDLDSALASDVQIDITRLDFGDQGPAEELFPPQWSVGEVIDRRSDDLAALAFGLTMEKSAIELYSQAALTCGSPDAQQTYDFLVEDETRHYNELKTRWESLAGMSFQES